MIITLYLLTSMVWDVEVIGTNQSNTNEILALLEKNHIKIPVSISRIEAKQLETLIHKNFKYKFVEMCIRDRNALTAHATAKYVLPVPAGPIPNVTSLEFIISTYLFCPTVFGLIILPDADVTITSFKIWL